MGHSDPQHKNSRAEHEKSPIKDCTVTTLRAQEAPVERSATCFWPKMHLYAFYWRRPGPKQHQHLKGPQTGLEMSSSTLQCTARKVRIKMSSSQRLPSEPHTVWGSQLLQLNENQSFFKCTSFARFWPKRGQQVSLLIVGSCFPSWIVLLVYKGCRCCWCKGSLRPTKLGWPPTTGMGGAVDYGRLTCSGEERLNVQLQELQRLQLLALEALSTWGRACYVKRTQAGCSMYVVADLGKTWSGKFWPSTYLQSKIYRPSQARYWCKTNRVSNF